MNSETVAIAKPNRLNVIFDIFFRVAALIFLVCTIRYWLQLIGYPDNSVRFDTMPVYWQSAVSVLSILHPVVALGLWINTQWGYVVWFFAAAIEVVMYGVYPNLFGEHFLILLFHAVIAAALVYKFILGKVRSKIS